MKGLLTLFIVAAWTILWLSIGFHFGSMRKQSLSQGPQESKSFGGGRMILASESFNGNTSISLWRDDATGDCFMAWALRGTGIAVLPRSAGACAAGAAVVPGGAPEGSGNIGNKGNELRAR